jgi:hypothetical protein
MIKTEYIKGYFKPTKEAEAKLNNLGIFNPAGIENASIGLWDSITVPVGIFWYKKGTPGTPGQLTMMPSWVEVITS